MARILGTGHAVPPHVVSNHELATFMDTSDEWIQQRSGIQERRWSRHGNTSEAGPHNADLAESAARMALEHAGISASHLDAIVYATITPDLEMPGSGALLQEKLCPGRSVAVLEVRNHCAGFLYALHAARAYIDAGAYKNVLVVGGEVQSTGLILSTPARNTAVLFGDGCGAFVLCPSASGAAGILASQFGSDGSYADKLGIAVPGFSRPCAVIPSDFDGELPLIAPRMEGQLVFKMAVTMMPQIVRAVVAKAGFSVSDLDVIVPHQANQRILDMVGKDLGCPEKIVINIQRYGNTTAGTIPIATSEAVAAGRIRPGHLVCLVSFGAGFSWGATLIRW